MRDAATPTSISRRQISATTAGDETTWGTPPAFTLMPTTSSGTKKRRHAASGAVSPVSARMPRSIISRTTSSTIAPCGSIEPAAVTDTTRPGNGPGMPGRAAGAYGVTTRYGGAGSSGASPASPAALPRAVAASGAAAIISRNALRSIVEAPVPGLYADPV